MASDTLIAETAAEYRAAHQTVTRRPDPAPATAIEQNARINAAFDGLVETHRLTLAAVVAVGSGDHELADETLRALVAELRTALRNWESFRSNSGGANGN